jgi:thiol:disulfide interchange protein DsbD
MQTTAVKCCIFLFLFAWTQPILSATEATTVVHWHASQVPEKALKPGEKFVVKLTGKIDLGWHIYALEEPEGGPPATVVGLAQGDPADLIGVDEGDPMLINDPAFQQVIGQFENSVEFSLHLQLHKQAIANPGSLHILVRFQSCNAHVCLPPHTDSIEAPLRHVDARGSPVSRGSVLTTEETEKQNEQIKIPATTPTAKAGSGHGREQPAQADKTPPAVNSAQQHDAPTQGPGGFVWLALGMGALSLLTPCVFPMIPITVSYFANHTGRSRTDSILQAGVYAAGIILTFSGVGMLLAVLFGAGGVNRLAANPWVNLFIAAAFVSFALSLFGAFYLQVPARLTNRLDFLSRSTERSGILGSLLMGVLFTLTSFTCTAPFVGTLLAMATRGDWRWPLLGMLAFSTVFAIPFFLLALAPQLLSSLPKAGGWMNSVKVAMGFLEIAASLKFLSNADLILGWGLFTRQVVLAVWIAIGLLLTAYVLGSFRTSHDSRVEVVTAPRIVFAITSLAASVWVTTGILGYPMGELEAFLPPNPQPALNRSETASAAGASVAEMRWILNDLPAAKAQAAAQNKPLFIDFTGYTCTNCRWMEANMFNRPEIQTAMKQFILVRLYTDGEGKLYRDQQTLQDATFGTVALPLYVLERPDGSVIQTFPGLTRDPKEFLNFLALYRVSERTS